MTPRLPEMFSCAAVFRRESRSRRSTYSGCTRFANAFVRMKMIGVTASIESANSQSTARNVIVVVRNSTTQSISMRTT